MLLPELSKWNDGTGISAIDWIALVGHFDHFIGYASLLWPRFVVHDNRIFLADLFEKARYEDMKGTSEEPHHGQLFMNTIDLASFFKAAKSEATHEQLMFLATTLTEAWISKASAAFPTRLFKVVIDDRLHEKGVGELLISMYETTA